MIDINCFIMTLSLVRWVVAEVDVCLFVRTFIPLLPIVLAARHAAGLPWPRAVLTVEMQHYSVS